MTGLEVLYLGSIGEERLRFPRDISTPLRILDQQVPPLSRLRAESRQAQLVGASSQVHLPWKETIHPIQMEKEPIGYVVLSAWRPATTPLDVVKELWNSWAKRGLDVKWVQLEEAWNRLPLASEDLCNAWNRHLRLIADEGLRQLEHPNQPHLHPDRLPPLIRKACIHLQENFRGSVTLTETASICGSSPEHLSRTFHQSTGLKFQDYLTETRIQAICQELKETSDSIGLIAERNGFQTLSRFNQAFKETLGKTPREWRKQQFRKSR